VSASLDRRQILRGGGLLVAFSFTGGALAQLAGGGEGGPAPKVKRPDLPGSLKNNPELDSWIHIAADGRATVFSGKAELGQGIGTALLQVAAEELDLPPASINFVTADTARTPDEGLTAGSHSMQDGGTAIANAAANVRMLLTQAAAKKWQVSVASLSTSGDGHVVAADGRRLAYGGLAASLSLHVEAIANAPSRLRRAVAVSSPAPPCLPHPKSIAPPRRSGPRASGDGWRADGSPHPPRSGPPMVGGPRSADACRGLPSS
jgi:hypothetical protein